MKGLLVAVVLVLLCAGCGSQRPSAEAMRTPAVGACHNLTTTQSVALSDDTGRVACTAPHDAETFASGSLPASYEKASYRDARLDQWAARTCGDRLGRWLGADDSSVMRSVLTAIWFRPSKPAWDAGARWYRCDVLGGSAGAKRLIDLPTTTKALLAGKPDDHWMVCARGRSVDDGTRVACSQAHDWRAVTTIKLGEAGDRYPGDAAVRAKAKDYCKSSVSAWLGYPADYDYGYTWFGAGEWSAGNRRAVCWAKTDQ